MDYRLLGPIEVVHDDHPLALGGAKQRALLADLLLHANHVVASEQLLEDLWGGGAGEGATHELQVYVSRLRKVLRAGTGDGEALRTRPPGYELVLGPGDTLDAEAFERAVHEGRALLGHDPAAAVERLERALALWRGPALGDLSSEPFAGGPAERLEELRRATLEDRLQAMLALGRHEEVAAEARALLAEHPLRERLWALLMLGLYRCGRQAEALAAYHQARERLGEELGIDPGPELTRLHERILAQDPDLEIHMDAAPLDGVTDAIPAPEPPSVAEERATRRLVTIAYFDTARGGPADRDPELIERNASSLAEIVRDAVERHGGTLEEPIGGGLYAIFGTSRAHEDDVLRALRAIADVRRALRDAGAGDVAHDPPVGIDTGEVLVSPGSRPVVGAAVDVARRLAQRASRGETIAADHVIRMARDAVVSEPVAAGGDAQPTFRVLSIAGVERERVRPARAPIVGRDRDLALLRQALDRAIAERRCHLVTLLGEAGVGKSRLVAEFLGTLDDNAQVLETRCLPYGDAAAMWPLVHLLRRALGQSTDAPALRRLLGNAPDAEVVAAVLERIVGDGHVDPPEPRDTRWATRRLLEELARPSPLVVVVDDLQWASDPIADVIEHVADLTREAPILLVCLARPELFEVRSGWGGGKPSATSMSLEPLASQHAERLLDELLKDHSIHAKMRHRLLETAGGNPLFLEEIVEVSADTGVLTIDEPTGPEHMPVPTTIQALLEARLDGLPADERRVLETASIVGEAFPITLVEALLGDPAVDVVGCLTTLARRNLALPDRPDDRGGEMFRFRHLAIHDACYAELPKRTRAGLHERLAGWLDAHGDEIGAEAVDLGTYHLDRAYRYLNELEAGGDAATRLRPAVADRMVAAGRRAIARDDMTSASGLLRRADELLDPDDARRPSVLLDLGSALAGTDIEGCADACGDAAALARGRGDRALEGRAEILRSIALSFLDATFAEDRYAEAAAHWRPVMEELDDPAGMAEVHRALAMIANWRVRWADVADLTHAAAACYRAAGERPRETELLVTWLLASLWGPTHREELERRIEDFTRRTEGCGPYTRMWIVHARGDLAVMRDDLREARRLHEECLRFATETGEVVSAGLLEICLADVEAADGCWRDAERRYRRVLEAQTGLADVAHSSTTAALLARTLARQGRDEALSYADEAEATSSDDDVTNEILIRQARALVASAAGDVEVAERLAREAVAISDGTQAPVLRGDARVDLAEVLAAAGRTTDAVDAVREAIAIHEQRGDDGRRRRAAMRLA
ncbi:MAG TPA: BTAD domain-containing putative transcriptional regulator, partial [Actinomycetota bacterium]|nr:BTAD domain-containing putative transcriptional regulator [Actinomycetota bacterium]